MQQSNTYIIIFTALMTIFFGFILSITRMKLEPIQDIQVEIDTKKKILGAVMEISSLLPEEILFTYDKKMKSVVVNIKGEIKDSLFYLYKSYQGLQLHFLFLVVPQQYGNL